MIHASETGLLYGILETVAMVSIVLAPMVSGLLYTQSPSLMYQVAFFGTLLLLALNALFLHKIAKNGEISQGE
jgi:hypothetical protein